jgi:PAS domain S-box-containing protein
MMRRIAASDIPAWADVFDLLPVGVIAIDAAGTVVYWSAHAERLYGWRKSEMLGRDIRELTAGSEEAEHAEEILAQVAAGEAWEGEFAARRKDGSKLLVRIVDAPLFDEGGDVVGMIGVSVGLDRLYEAERREKLEALEQAMSRISSFVAGLSVGDDADRPELDALTPRQREVVTLLQRGLRVRTIADRLGISESTARNHLGVVYRRLGVRSQRELLELLSEPPRP